jgi:hypothetical protein
VLLSARDTIEKKDRNSRNVQSTPGMRRIVAAVRRKVCLIRS